ncbi:MAG: hypothetical protein DSY60_03615 [Persephonella sp.]|nr:MAG: hypothetical protein DSY60_03615 [Persephonella sp.]
MILRVGWINFINTLPFDFELFNSYQDIKKIYGTPAEINKLLNQCKVDIGLVSSAEYIENFEKYLILPNLSISSFKKVYSVGIFSNKPLEDENIIYLSRKSKTSRLLTKVLVKLVFNKDIEYRDLEEYKDIDKKTVLLIGDNALKFSKKFKYIYDLSELWYRKTNLPFVFALWCVNREFYEKNKKEILFFYKLLKETKEKFFKDINTLIKPIDDIPKEYIKFYLKNLDYALTDKHIKSLKLFSEYLLQLGIIKDKPEFSFIEV